MAGAVHQVSLFVAWAVFFDEISNDCSKRNVAHGKREKQSQLSGGLLGSFLDHSRITLGSCSLRFSDRPRTVNDVSACFSRFRSYFWSLTFRGRRRIWCCWRVTLVAPPNVNGVSCVASIENECRSSIVFCIP